MASNAGTGCLISLQNGLHFGWTSPFFVELTNDKEHYDITEEQASVFTTLPPIVTILSCPLVTWMCNAVGRKTTLLAGAVPFILSWVLEVFATDVYTFYIARALTGLGTSASTASLSMYIGEIATPEIRSFWGNFLSIFLGLGQFMINLIGFHFSVSQASYICLVPAFLFVFTFPLMPESPYYLLMKGKEDGAKRSLKKLTRKKDIEVDFEQLKTDVNRQMSDRGNWGDLVFILANRKALTAGILMRCAQMFCGASAFPAYTRYIFEKAVGDSETSTLVFSGVMVIMTLLAGFTIDRLGRKKSFVISMCLSIVCLLFLSIFYYIEEFQPQVDISNLLWMPVAGMVAYMTFSSFGVVNVPTIMLGELFSASIKAKGLTVLLCVMGLMISLTNYLFFWLNVSYGMFCPFLVFAIVSTVLTVLCFYMIPETKCKTLEEIQQILGGNVQCK
ncbi:unnamed protein product [Acanthoscelides obtectus]|uniref:Major facilitator superfamily (MFS) profile domain-containing protein n=1 Tax=Acanthoscelides obtectus TaxID=200917 RepID=A0A9P0PJA8_ACAOB|nr:unnamed protein product [Acanthoscelides obtectus]CAK1650192.1 Facilitated trehalose transporter Tret1 [Acanthoscelides obtectus]